jgi:hypothetical protein
MKAWYSALPTPMKVAIAVVGGAVCLVGLLFFYDWLGTALFDTGGTVG